MANRLTALLLLVSDTGRVEKRITITPPDSLPQTGSGGAHQSVRGRRESPRGPV